MRILRGMSWSVLAVGVALVGGACGPTDELAVSRGGLETTAGAAGSFCGGIGAIRCDEGYVCVDDPRDTCDPRQGGADCGGVCVPDLEPSSCGNEPGYDYLFTDPKRCEGVRFKCAAGQEAFFNDCGCGCRPAA